MTSTDLPGSDVPEGEAMAALAAQVADLRGRVALAEAWRGKHSESISALPEQVKELAKSFNEILETGCLMVTAPYWLDLSESDYESQIADLKEWVSKVLIPNYPQYARILRPCWIDHREAAWELSNLAAEWKRIYDRRYPELKGALDFHDRWLPGVLARLEPLMRSCGAGQCTAPEKEKGTGE